MISPKTRRESEIWQACETLYLELGQETGEGMTGDKIVNKLLDLGYKKGSPNEIYRYRKSWFEMRGIEKSPLPLVAVHSDPLNRAVQLVKEEIEKEAKAEVAEIKAAYERQLKQMEDNYHSTKAELLQFIEKNDNLTGLLQQAQEENSTLMASHQKALEQNALLMSQVSLLENQSQTLEATYTQSLAALNEMSQAQQKEGRDQWLALKAAWEKDAGDYKELNESQRHKFMMEVENLRGEIRRLSEKLRLVEFERFAAQQLASQIKTQQKAILGERQMSELLTEVRSLLSSLKKPAKSKTKVA